jgi:hypothetical protein
MGKSMGNGVGVRGRTWFLTHMQIRMGLRLLICDRWRWSINI